jgi:hypothetical protein
MNEIELLRVDAREIAVLEMTTLELLLREPEMHELYSILQLQASQH